MKKLSSLIISLCFSCCLYSQVTQLDNISPLVQGPFLGWDATGFPLDLDIKTEYNQSINFYTFAGINSFNNLRMQIFDAGTFPYNAGFIGMGLLNPPRLNLEVQSIIGLIPLVWEEGYHIDSVPILRSWPLGINMTNIFVGRGAGFNAGNIGTGLTFVGRNAGLNNTTATGKTFIGFETGTAITTEVNNTFIGNHAGDSAIIGERNTFQVAYILIL